jgi:hypothetical protein
MFFHFTTVALVASCALSNAATLKHKRTTDSVTLYAYGGIANGAEVFYIDSKSLNTGLANVLNHYKIGLAYIGQVSTPSWASVATNISFTVDPASTTTAWTIAPNATNSSSNVTFNSTLSMYIVTTTEDFQQVGFTSTSDALPTGATTIGFTFMGTSAVYVASESDYQMRFWASTTNVTDLYALYWNGGGNATTPNGSFPVVLKTTAPTILTTV